MLSVESSSLSRWLLTTSSYSLNRSNMKSKTVSETQVSLEEQVLHRNREKQRKEEPLLREPGFGEDV